MKKYLCIVGSLVLAVSLLMVPAPAVAADPVGLNLITVGEDSTAEWVDAETIEPCAGDYSLELYVLKGEGDYPGDGVVGGGAGVYIPVNVAIKDIDSLSFARLGTIGDKDAKMHLLIDANNDGDLDFNEIDVMLYDLCPPGYVRDEAATFGEDAILWLNPTGDTKFITGADWTTVDVYNTYQYWGTDKTAPKFFWPNRVGLGQEGGVQEVGNGAIDPTDRVLGVIVFIGAGSGVADQTVYIDDIEINGVTYELEEALSGWHVYQGQSIQDAIDIVASGDTVNVAAGTYDEQVVIDKQLTLNGANANESIIDGGITTAVTISANDVIVDGFTLDGGITLDDRLNTISGGTISNNIITRADSSVEPIKAQNGIRVGFDLGGLGVDRVIIEDNIISDNLRAGIEFSNAKEEVPYGGDGIQRISNITISGNEIKNNGTKASGISTYGPGPNTIINNIISNNRGAGMSLRSSNGDIVTGNTITSNAGPGITLGNATGATVENNSISGHQEVEADKEWKGSGIHILKASEDNIIRFNDISDNNYGVFIRSKVVDGDLLQPSGNSITYNDIAGNSYGILNALVDPSAPVDATNNYWGHASGPGHALYGKWVGKGNEVSDNVDYKLWLHKSKKDVVGKKKPAYAQSVDLDKTGEYGWNTFSAPIFLDEEADIWEELCELTDLEYSVAYRFDSDIQEFVGLGTGDDYAINPCEGFFIKMDDVGILPILYSTEVNLMPPSRPLTAGWNLIGLANLKDMDVDDAFASIAEAPGLAGYSQVVSPIGNVVPGPVLADGKIYVGESYWVYMLSARTLAGFTMTPVEWVP